jgi:hypothetical protein
LCAVVQIALQAASGIIGGRDDARAGGGECCVGFVISDGGSDEFGKLTDPLLGVRWQWLRWDRADNCDTSEPALDDDRRFCAAA